MALQEINKDAVQPTVQTLLAFLDREDISIPGNMLESIVSAKSLMRAIMNDQLVIAQRMQPEAQPQEVAEEDAATEEAA